MLCQHGETSASLICFRQIDIDVENLFVRKMGGARPAQTIPQKPDVATRMFECGKYANSGGLSLDPRQVGTYNLLLLTGWQKVK